MVVNETRTQQEEAPSPVHDVSKEELCIRLQIMYDILIRTATLKGATLIERRLSELRGIFVDDHAYEAALAAGDPVVYNVQSVAPAEGEGALHYALGSIQPGRIGDEFYMTKGHLHAWRLASEIYIGLSGQGMMILEDEHSGQSEAVPLVANSIVYVPGATAHRTANTGDEPLVYLGIYAFNAGHDYATIAERNFRKLLVGPSSKPILADRAAYLSTRHKGTSV